MRIAIDCRMLNCSGIGTFTRGILPFIINSTNDEFLLLGDKTLLKEYHRPNVSIQHCTIPIFSIKELLFFPVRLINQCDIFYSPNYNIPIGINIPIVSTIHDVIFLDMDHLCSVIGKIIRQGYLYYAISRTKKIITPSEFSKSRILHHFSTDKKIIVCYNGLNEKINRFIQSNKRKSSSGDYIVFVGNIKKHKGLETLIQAFELAKQKGLKKKLLIIGSRDNFKTSDTVDFDTLDESIVFTGRLDDEELFMTLQNANALIQPSLYEGFGIPPLEAMTLGTPAIISDIPVFKEIYHDFPVRFFKAGNIDDLADALLSDYTTEPLGKTLSAKYSYERTANMILKELHII